VPWLDGIRLHLADEVFPVWHAVQLETGDPDAPIPFWAFAWGGGLALGRYLRDHPDVVAGRRVFDLASGSGLCAIVAMDVGAVSASASDIDPFAIAAIRLNARANGHRVGVVARDVLDEPPPDADVILAGDCWYEEPLARRALPWLQRARDAGLEVVIGDPGRDHLPVTDLVEIATYDARTTSHLEDLRRTQARIFRLR